MSSELPIADWFYGKWCHKMRRINVYFKALYKYCIVIIQRLCILYRTLRRYINTVLLLLFDSMVVSLLLTAIVFLIPFLSTFIPSFSSIPFPSPSHCTHINPAGRSQGLLSAFSAATVIVWLKNVFWYIPPQLFYGPFSGTTRLSRCRKRTSGLYGARED